VFPALLGGAPATTVPVQKGISKASNIKEPANTSGRATALALALLQLQAHQRQRCEMDAQCHKIEGSARQLQ